MKDLITFEQSLAVADQRFFRQIINPDHCAHSVLPPLNFGIVRLRHNGHQYCIPDCKYELYKRSFVQRSLFNMLKPS